MAYDITIGKSNKVVKSATYKNISFEKISGQAPEGLCKKEFTPYPLDPIRMPSTNGWHDFSDKYLRGELAPNSNDGWVYSLVNHKEVLHHITLKHVLESMEPYERDRAAWLSYWCKRAIEEFGEYAAIKFY